MGLVCKMFAGESRSGAFPALSEVPGRLAFTTEPPEGEYGVYPEYLTDVTTLYCPLGTPVPDPMIDPLASINDQDYLYLGHAVANDAEVLSFAQAYRDAVEKGLPLSGDFDVAVGTGSGGGNQILRLKEGIERYYVTDINNPAVVGLNQSRIAAIIERPGHHKQGGGHVLFMDGHVEFIPYPGKWPMTPTTIATLLELADME
jgi:prepilin-type processing-associated H-X9-DG protein